MAIPTIYAPQFFTGNNSTSTAYVCNWKALDITNLRVIETDEDGVEQATLAHGSGMTVTLVGNTVEFVTTSAIPATSTVAAFLTSDFLQSRDLQNSGNNDVDVREDMFDKLTLMLQIALAGVSETSGIPIAFPPGEDPVTQTLPSAPNRANAFLYFDSSGDLTTYLYATLIADILALINTGTGDAADALQNRVVGQDASFTLSNGNGWRLHVCDASSGDITVTCPQDSDETIPIGWKTDFVLDSASSAVIFAQGTGATIKSASGNNPQIGTQNGGATVVKTAADEWTIFGRIEASA